MLLRNACNSFTFKKISNNDRTLLSAWFKESHVQQWWPVLKPDESIEHFLERIRSKDTHAYLVSLDALPIGYIQYYYIDPTVPKAGAWLPKLPKTTVGLDQFIGDPHYVGKGYGTAFIKEFITFLTHHLDQTITTIIVDPKPTNCAAIKCYQKVGFREICINETPLGAILLMQYDVKIEELFH